MRKSTEYASIHKIGVSQNANLLEIGRASSKEKVKIKVVAV